MSSLLFQSTGKGDGGSSSTSAANPFMNLAHFYEQELTDQHIDSRSSSSSRQYRQQTPVTPSKMSHIPKPTMNSRILVVQVPIIITIPMTLYPFSNTLAAIMGQTQDRKDGLGPIVDFSQHISTLIENGQYSPEVKSRLENHLEARHHNPYAEKRQFSRGMRASSQREQVLMDMNQGGINSLESDLDSAWKESMLAPGSSSTRPTDLSTTTTTYLQEATMPKDLRITSRTIETEALHGSYGPQQHHTNLNSQMQEPINSHATVMNRDWADEFARAALTSSQSQSDQVNTDSTGRRDSLKTCGFILDPKNNHDFSFSDPATVLSFETSTVPVSSSPITSAPTFNTHQHYGDNLITQIPVPAHSAPEPLRVINEVYNDDVFEDDMLQAWMETLAQEKQEADERAKESHQPSIPEPVETYNDDGFESDLLQAWKESLEQEKQESDERTKELIDKTIPVDSVEMAAVMDREIYNDDVFEGDMLQSWMETLALEKQEAKENEEKLRQAKDDVDKEEEENKSDNRLLDETEQKLILEMALRRLNGLMHQLGQKQGLLEGTRAGMWRGDDNKIAE
ncbi:hypothetical protein BGZ80_002467 [Entomortierella chlamydospora]|uniref:Uncharacterized protein n=1 Tax=Entomortierella chlamydospora TaxID=101097 RepID=A0A9P6N1H8_9FUNG|nr:hypothetical protein BGZ80_002467 [Entomortierella chlamydospora]